MKKLLGAVVFALILGIGFTFYKKSEDTTKNAEATSQVADQTDREPATTGMSQDQILARMNEAIINIKSRSEVKSVAAKIVQMAAAPEALNFPGVQMYATVAKVVPQLEGVIYRCRAFVETSDWLHMSTLFGLRDFKYNNYLYGTHVNAMFDFMTYPSEAAGKPFKSVSELQDYMLFQVAPQIEDALKLWTQFEKLPSKNFEFQFDRTLLVGKNNGLRFLDPEETKKMFIKPYFYTAAFVLQRALGTIYYVGSMDLNELPVVYNKILRQTGINNFVGNLRVGELAKGVTPELSYEIIKKSESFLNWRTGINYRTQDGKIVNVATQTLLDKSFYYGLVSAQNQLAAYVCSLKYSYLRSRGEIMEISDISKDCMTLDQVGSTSSYFVTEGSKFLFNPNSMILNFKQKYTMFYDRYRAYVESSKGKPSRITSDVTGKSIQVNVKALFSTKVSQRDFLPTKYMPVPASSAAATLPSVHAWNYEHGKPMGFKDYTFGGFFEKSEVSDSPSLYNAMATLLYTQSVAPFAIFIRVPSTARYFIPPTEIINQ